MELLKRIVVTKTVMTKMWDKTNESAGDEVGSDEERTDKGSGEEDASSDEDN